MKISTGVVESKIKTGTEDYENTRRTGIENSQANCDDDVDSSVIRQANKMLKLFTGTYSPVSWCQHFPVSFYYKSFQFLFTL